jgi:hypothetical protein
MAHESTIVEQKRKYIRPADVERQYAIRPGKLYDLINKRLVKSIRLSEGTARKGTRLIEVESLENYLASLAATQVPRSIVDVGGLAKEHNQEDQKPVGAIAS